MPFEWVRPLAKAPESSGAFCHADGDAPAAVLHLWPHRSLPRRGFVLFIGLTCGLIAIPLLALLGSPVLWGLLPFFVLVVAGVWIALQRSYRDGQVLEELSLWSDHMALMRRNPRGPRQHWDANPHWVKLRLRETGGPVENYLTLHGGGREVELGAFLSPEERKSLFDSLQTALARLR
jgi:uncharacterized membrane protein